MKTSQHIAMSGASGFVGTALGNHLSQCGHHIIPITREMLQKEDNTLEKILSNCDTVINLAGAPINHRWNKSYKQQLYDSRILVTRKLIKAANLSSRIKTFISTSAVGYYPPGDCYDEFSGHKGNGFLSDLCQHWENEASKLSCEKRLVITRFGIVLAAQGGAFEQMIRTVPTGITNVIGNGKQPFSWIDIIDLCRAFEFILDSSQLSGAINLTSPQHLTQGEFMDIVGKHYRTFLTVHIPAFVFKLQMGEAASFLLNGQCVEPTRLLQSGFTFSSPDLESFLKRISITNL